MKEGTLFSKKDIRTIKILREPLKGLSGGERVPVGRLQKSRFKTRKNKIPSKPACVGGPSFGAEERKKTEPSSP